MNKNNRNRRNKNIFDIGGDLEGSLDGLTSAIDIVGEPGSLEAFETAQDNLGGLSTGSSGLSGGLMSIINEGSRAVGTIGGKLLSQGMDSKAGNAITGIGSALGAVPILGGVAEGALNLIGGGVNALVGSKVNQANVDSVNASIAKMNSNSVADANTFDALNNKIASSVGMTSHNKSFYGKDGLLTNKVGKLRDKMEKEAKVADKRQQLAIMENLKQLNSNQLAGLEANYAALGGPLGTNGADWTNGLLSINTGGSHEQNPYGGVNMGIDAEGTPNQVEEGETIFNDYVFSRRIKVPKAIRKKYKLKDNITFADASKQLAKESEERPNDPISQKALNAAMADLAYAQEEINNRRSKGNKFAEGGDMGEIEDWILDNYDNIEDFKEAFNDTNSIGSSRRNIFKNLTLSDLRYVPALGSAFGAIKSMIDRPDYTNADALINTGYNVDSAGATVGFNPIGNYLTYKPFDRQFYINQMNSQAGATRRGLLNTAGMNRGAAMAGLLAADNNYLNQVGNLGRQAEEFNFNNLMQVANFNRATNEFNSEGKLKADIATAENRGKSRALGLEAISKGYQLRQAIRDARDTAISANFTNLFDNVGNIGWEEYQRRAIESNPAFLGWYQNRSGDLGYKSRSAKHGGFLTIKKK